MMFLILTSLGRQLGVILLVKHYGQFTKAMIKVTIQLSISFTNVKNMRFIAKILDKNMY